MEEGNKKHFVLVHGGCHGAWCWYKLVTCLRSAGHRVTALDLGAAGLSPKRLNDIPSFSDYIEPLINFLENYRSSLPTTTEGAAMVLPADNEKVILVGHSLGGLAISKAMESFPEKIYVAVFVTALMPDPTLDLSSLVQLGRTGDNRLTYEEGMENSTTTFIYGPNYMATYVYQHCPPEDLNLATMLIRPVRLYTKEDISKQTVVSEEKYGSVRRVYIISGQDKSITVDLQRQIIKNDPMVEVKEIAGSDHMVMLSKPQELFDFLEEIIAE